MEMNSKKKDNSGTNLVLPGDKIAVIEEFLPNEFCYEQDGGIYSRVLGHVVTDPKKHKISVVPTKPHRSIKIGDIGIGRVEFMKKQIAMIDIYHLNQEDLLVPVSAVLHISEASRRFVKNMYEVTRPGDWLRFKIIRAVRPLYISLIGKSLGVIIAFCIHCGHELKYKRRNILECLNCEHSQPRITSKSFGKPLIRKMRQVGNETK